MEDADDDEQDGRTSVQCRWQRLCVDTRLQAQVEMHVRWLKQVRVEATHVANMHVLRCLHNQLPLPDFSQTFFERCCRGVLIGRAPCKDEELETTLKQYSDMKRDRSLIHARVGCSHSIACLDRQLHSNALAHISTNLSARLRRHLIRLGESRADAHRLVRTCWRTDDELAPDELDMRM